MEAEENRLTTEQVIKKLAGSKLFLGVPFDEVAGIVRSNTGKISSYQKGEILIHEGETWNTLDVVLDGEVSVNRLFQDGSESRVHLLRENGIIGMEFMRKPEYGSQFYYIAQTDVAVYSIHQWYFMDHRQLGEKVSFQMLKNIISVLSHENIRQHRRLDILSTRDLRGRILVYLNYERKKQKKNEFYIPYGREALAAHLCANRSALSRELGRMEKDGLLKTKGRFFALTDGLPEK